MRDCIDGHDEHEWEYKCTFTGECSGSSVWKQYKCVYCGEHNMINCKEENKNG